MKSILRHGSKYFEAAIRWMWRRRVFHRAKVPLLLMSIAYFASILIALFIGAAIHLLCRRLFGLWKPLPVAILWIFLVWSAKVSLFPLWAALMLFWPMIVLGSLGAYFLGATIQGASTAKYLWAFATMLCLENVCLSLSDLLSNRYVPQEGNYALLYWVALILSPTLTAFIVWWRLKATKSLPIEGA